LERRAATEFEHIGTRLQRVEQQSQVLKSGFVDDLVTLDDPG
jgi:hypothetical protein